jgi:uncharacterized damage-inducible protein DinB
MTVKDLNDLYDYGYWANRRLLQVVSQLAPEQFTQTVAGGHGSIRDTLVHVLSAEWGWLSRCGGPERGPALRPDDFPTVDSLADAWRRVEGHMGEFLSTLQDQDLVRSVEYANPHGQRRSMALGELMRHGANHGVHHRGQIALLLRVLGSTPVNVDMLLYYAETRGVPAW